MSLFTLSGMAVDAIERRKHVQSVALDTPKQEPPAPASQQLDRIAAFIPADAIGIYIAGLGIFGPVQLTRRWIVFFVTLALVPLFICFGVLSRRATSASKGELVRPLVLLSVFGMVAFTVWAAAMPETPFASLVADARGLGAFGALVLAGLLPPLAKVLKIA